MMNADPTNLLTLSHYFISELNCEFSVSQSKLNIHTETFATMRGLQLALSLQIECCGTKCYC